MGKARNGVRHSLQTKRRAIQMREKGKTHREIAHELHISTCTAWLWIKEVQITPEQRQAIHDRRVRHKFTPEEKALVLQRLAKVRDEQRYSPEELLDKIRHFFAKHGRIPLKREFNSLRVYRLHFGSWNNAIRVAGFEPNPVLFANKFIAQDGHACDSFTEKVIDDWLHEHGFAHSRNIAYGNTRYTADFGLGNNIVLEFFGLANVQKEYDAIISKKRELARKLGWHLIEMYPEDIYPNKLPLFLGTHPEFEWCRRTAELTSKKK